MLLLLIILNAFPKTNLLFVCALYPLLIALTLCRFVQGRNIGALSQIVTVVLAFMLMFVCTAITELILRLALHLLTRYTQI
jgi:hypothetical protein